MEAPKKKEKNDHREKLIGNFAICEILTEGIGQNVLQLYILRVSLGQDRILLPRLNDIKDLNSNSWKSMNFSDVSEDGNVRPSVDCHKWDTTGARHCWSPELSKNMSFSLQCFIADCESISLDFWKLLPLVKLAIAAIPMSLKLVQRIYGSYIHESERHYWLKKGLTVAVFVPFISVSIVSSMFFGCFLGVSVYTNLESRFGATAIMISCFTIFRVIPAHYLRFTKAYRGESITCTSILVRIWEVCGPFANYLIYFGIAIYYNCTEGHDVIRGHTVGLHNDPISKNVYFEADKKWTNGIKEMYKNFPAAVQLREKGPEFRKNMTTSIQIRSEFNLFGWIYNHYGYVCIGDLLFTFLVLLLFYCFFDPWTRIIVKRRRRTSGAAITKSQENDALQKKDATTESTKKPSPGVESSLVSNGSSPSLESRPASNSSSSDLDSGLTPNKSNLNAPENQTTLQQHISAQSVGKKMFDQRVSNSNQW